jgi:hypothetical protein
MKNDFARQVVWIGNVISRLQHSEDRFKRLGIISQWMTMTMIQVLW